MVRSVSRNYQAPGWKEDMLAIEACSDRSCASADFALKEVDQRASKLHFQFAGPYEVIQQRKNDVVVRNIIHGNILIFPVDRLKPFYGSKADVSQLSQLPWTTTSMSSIRSEHIEAICSHAHTACFWFGL